MRMTVMADQKVIEHRHLREDAQHLERAGDAAAGNLVRLQSGDILSR